MRAISSRRRVIADAVRRSRTTREFVYDHRPPHSKPLVGLEAS